MTEHGLALVNALYLGLSLGTLAFLLLWEDGGSRVPFASKAARWRHIARNLVMLFWVVVAADIAIGQGVLHAWEFLIEPPIFWLEGMTWPLPVQIAVGFLASDLLEYAMHVASHRLKWFWRLHKVHHTDPHLDATTAARVHPLETSLYAASKIALYAVLGLPLWIEGIRAILHNCLLLVQHANVVYPPALERLRWLLVTPAMHRVHHDPEPPLLERNFGAIFSFWDRLFGTYESAESAGSPRVGLKGYTGEKWQTVSGMLLTPFAKERARTTN